MTTKVLYNVCHGGIYLSPLAAMRMAQLESEWAVKALARKKDAWSWPSGLELDNELPRHDPLLIRVVEELGLKESAGDMTKFKIYELRGDRYRIEEYDGWEKVVEPEDLEWVVIK